MTHEYFGAQIVDFLGAIALDGLHKDASQSGDCALSDDVSVALPQCLYHFLRGHLGCLEEHF